MRVSCVSYVSGFQSHNQSSDKLYWWLSPVANGMAMTICQLKLIFEIASGVLAFIAAGFWFYASWIGRNSFLQMGVGEFEEIQRSQAFCNAVAAFCAGTAALLQIVTAGYMPVCRAFS